MNIAWSPQAIEDLVSLRAYIADDNAAAAQRVVQQNIQNIEQLLPDNPQIGRAGRVPGTRELVIPRKPYIVPYRLQRTTIQILRVYHAALAATARTSPRRETRMMWWMTPAPGIECAKGWRDAKRSSRRLGQPASG